MMRIVLILFTAMLVLLTGCKSAQIDPALDAEKKETEKAEQQAWYDMALEAVNDREFVLEAERLDFKRGRFAYVTSSTNFISVDGDRATIQMAFNTPYSGPNGLGGITVDGRVTNVTSKTDKKGNVDVSMTVQGAAVSAKVDFRLMQGSNRCTATVTPNFNSNRVSFTGYIYPKSESNVFKGRSI